MAERPDMLATPAVAAAAKARAPEPMPQAATGRRGSSAAPSLPPADHGRKGSGVPGQQATSSEALAALQAESVAAQQQAADSGAALHQLQARVDELQHMVEALLSQSSSQPLILLPSLPLLSGPAMPAPAEDLARAAHISPQPDAPTAHISVNTKAVVAPAQPAAPRMSCSVSIEAAAQKAASAAVASSAAVADLAERMMEAEACSAVVAGMAVKMKEVDGLVEKVKEVAALSEKMREAEKALAPLQAQDSAHPRRQHCRGEQHHSQPEAPGVAHGSPGGGRPSASNSSCQHLVVTVGSYGI